MVKVKYNQKKEEYNVYYNNKIIASSSMKENLFNSLIKSGFIFFKVFKNKFNFLFLGLLIIKDKYQIINDHKINFQIDNKKYKLKIIYPFYLKIPIINLTFKLVGSKIPVRDFITNPIHNKVTLNYINNNNYGFNKSIRYNFFTNRGSKYKNSTLILLNEHNSAVYFRQSIGNRIFLTIREQNKTDYKREQLKLIVAYYGAKIISVFKKDTILLFEKNANRYEESASVLYEKLIDLDYKNVYFVIDKNNMVLEKIASKYLSRIIYKYSFKHYLYFFLAKTFIGSETLPHVIELRVANKYVLKKIYRHNYKYVFLQHGVMYMVSLASEQRRFARKSGNIIWQNAKVVVSSKLEADHFVQLGEYNQEDLYISGLPKFDKSIRRVSADKIVIMPTWRPWEYNEFRNEPTVTGYYKMLLEILNNVPKEYHDKVIILPHPLFKEQIKDEYITPHLTERNYNEILEETLLLITDYSSIAYDAFYRGANVIFWWKEKDYCMEQYNGYLMLDQSNAFGDICYSSLELIASIKRNYKQEQSSNYISKFRKIVEFNDNKNTERLIEYLEKDKII